MVRVLGLEVTSGKAFDDLVLQALQCGVHKDKARHYEEQTEFYIHVNNCYGEILHLFYESLSEDRKNEMLEFIEKKTCNDVTEYLIDILNDRYNPLTDKVVGEE